MILDSDGEGLVTVGGRALTGGTRVAPGIYSGGDGFVYAFAGDPRSAGTLVVNGVLTIENFRDGDLGIRLGAVERPVAIVAPTGYALYGDEPRSHLGESAPNDPVWGRGWYDLYCNPLALGEPRQWLYDFFRGSPGAREIHAGLGEDHIE